MTPNDFVIWLKGFTQAANNFTLTPKQWDDIKEQLDRVELNERLSRYTLDINTNNSNWLTTTTTADGRNDITYKTDVPTTNTI
jgi:hypothetical protein